MNCIYCGKEILNKGSLKSHQNRCQHNPNKIAYKKRGKDKKKRKSSWNKGLTKQTDQRILKASLKTKERIKKLKDQGLYINKGGRAKTQEKEIERKKKLSEAAKRRHFGGFKQGSGRGKKGWYKGYWCDSSWELAFVIYNLEHDIKFERNNQGFEYEFKNQKHKFYPDFIMEDGTYVEIKGVLTEQNKIKIQTFNLNHRLKVIGKQEINEYLNYVIEKYSKNFIQLYDIKWKSEKQVKRKYKYKYKRKRNIKSKKQKEKRICLVCNKEFIPVKKNSKFCSHECSKVWNKRNIPSKQQLLQDLKELHSLVSIGKKYGKTDNAVKRWFKMYGFECSREGMKKLKNNL